MITIISSEIVEDSTQIDGRRQIIERHITNGGTIHEFVWMAEPEQDIAPILAARADILPKQILREIEDKEFGNGLYS